MDELQQRKFITKVTYYAIIAILAILFLRYPLPYLMPFIIGWLVAALLKKPIQWLTNKTKIPRTIVSIAVVLLFYILLMLLAVLLGIELVDAAINYFSELPAFYKANIEPTIYAAYDTLAEFIANLEPDVIEEVTKIFNAIVSKTGELVTSISMIVVSWLSSFITKVPGTLVKTLLAIISSILIAIDYQAISSFLMQQFNEEQKKVIWEIQTYLVDTILGTLKCYMIIMLITACELTLGFVLMGISNAVIIACSIAVLDILPVLGSGTVLIPWAIVDLILGNYKLAIELFILYAVITVIRQIIEPHIVGKQMGLHPVVSMASMFIGLQVAGIVGMLGFPILISLIVHLNQTGIIHLYKNSEAAA